MDQKCEDKMSSEIELLNKDKRRIDVVLYLAKPNQVNKYTR